MNDLISRQAAIDALMKRDKELRNINWYDKPFAEGECRGIDYALEIVNALPSAQPEKTQLSKEDTTSDCISRQAAIEASSDIYARVPDIYNVICAQRDVRWRLYQSNKKMDPSDPHTAQLFHEWLTLDSTARLFTDPVELETIKEIYHLNEED